MAKYDLLRKEAEFGKDDMMLTITEFQVENIKDPFRILEGKRYEYKLDIEVPEDDELYSENGLFVRALYSDQEDGGKLVKYDLYEKSTEAYLDFDLEDDEVQVIEAFCRDHLGDAEE
ncbi:DUF6509 family protein [Paenibacillus dokdonensis]|nr:DUF6509 family protein [Paenibacillus dokdonensis]